MIQVSDSYMQYATSPNLPNIYIYNIYRVIGTYTIQCYPQVFGWTDGIGHAC